MRLINWNISAFNRKAEKALDSILGYEPDILCLQELPRAAIEYLKKFPDYNLVHSPDVEAKQIGKNADLAILTKYKITGSGCYEYSQDGARSFFIWCSEMVFGRTKQLKSLYADIATPAGIKRVHTLHLSWPVGPETRMKQFSRFLEAAEPEDSHIICGDLNIFGNLRNNILAAALFGYRFRELFVNEKKVFAKIFESRGWQNPFAGTVSSTWPWSLGGAQLDYVLLPKTAVIKSALLLKETYGSDHRAQILEIAEVGGQARA